MSPILWVTVAVIILGGWNSRNLWSDWQTTPIESLTWLLFLIWIIPVFFVFLKPGIYRDKLPNRPLLLISVLAGFLANIFDLNVLSHLGFAAAIGSLAFFSWKMIPWLLAGVLWLPAFGWWSLYHIPSPLLFRFLLAISGTAWAFFILNREDRV